MLCGLKAIACRFVQAWGCSRTLPTATPGLRGGWGWGQGDAGWGGLQPDPDALQWVSVNRVSTEVPRVPLSPGSRGSYRLDEHQTTVPG